MGIFKTDNQRPPKQKKSTPLARPTDEAAVRAIERSKRLDDDSLFQWIDAAISDLHRAVDQFHYHGGPVEEVTRCQGVLDGLLADLPRRARPTSTS